MSIPKHRLLTIKDALCKNCKQFYFVTRQDGEEMKENALTDHYISMDGNENTAECDATKQKSFITFATDWQEMIESLCSRRLPERKRKEIDLSKSKYHQALKELANGLGGNVNVYLRLVICWSRPAFLPANSQTNGEGGGGGSCVCR